MERKISTLGNLDEDFLLLQQKSGRLQGKKAMRLRRQHSCDLSPNSNQLSPTQKSSSLTSLPHSTSSRSSLGDLVGNLRADSFGGMSMSQIPENQEPISDDVPERLQPFLKALDNDDLDLLKDLHTNLVNTGEDFSNRDLHLEDGRNILHLSVQMESELTGFIIEKSEPAFLTESFTSALGPSLYKTTALHLLVEKDEGELTRALLEKLSNIPFWQKYDFLKLLTTIHVGEKRVQLMSALHIAAMKGNLSIVKLLVQQGTPVDITNESKETPLMWGVWGHRVDMVKALVEMGASPNHQDDKASTPLYWATRYGYTDIVSFLLEECKVNVNHRRKFGYVLPLVLASAMGHTTIVHDLLVKGAHVNATVSGGKTALHYASAHGHDDIIKTLLEFGATINTPDENGNTPLIHATKENQSPAIKTLLAKGADMARKNKMGLTVWDFIIESEDTSLLKMYVEIYKVVNNIKSDVKFSFEKGRTPIHIAALKNNAAKVLCLLDLNLDWKCVDDMGNTFLHTAAREDATLILDQFVSELDPCIQNEHGDTPLHIAVKHGHVDSVKILINRSTLGARNNVGSTPLHVAAWSDNSSSEVVRILVESILACNNWSLLDAADWKGNTALHIAAKKGRTDVIEELHALDTKAINRDGDNPLHVAALSGGSMTLESILEVFRETCNDEFPDANFQRVCLDQQNGSGDTLLHICARQGDFENVKNLIEEGANLGMRNHSGNTVLHDLVEQAVQIPSKKESYLQVYNVIVKLSSTWWCKWKGYHIPDEESSLSTKYQRTAMLHLTSGICNNEGRCVMAHCVAVGATAILEAILNTPNVYRFAEEDEYSFDITGLSPDTEMDGSKTLEQIMKGRAGSIITQDPMVKCVGEEGFPRGNESCLDIIIGMKSEVLATKMLDIAPIRQLVKNYWTAYQLVYGFFMISHIIFMSFFTQFGIHSITAPHNDSKTVHVHPFYIEENPNIFPPIVLLIWPIAIIAFEVYYMVTRNRRIRSRKKSDLRSSITCSKNIYKECFGIPYKIFSSILDFASHLSGIFFALAVFTWFLFYELSVDSQAYVLSVALMFGWMFTISFAKGFETVHSFSIILKHIFVRDITRFLFIYMFIMFGFSLAFHVLFQLVPAFAQRYHSGWDTFFMTLNVMLGLEDSLFEDFESSYITAVAFIKVIYVLYVLFSSIILLNLLIAMMTDTYANIISREGTTWRLGSVRLALKIERSFPFLKTIFKKIGIIQNTITFDPTSQRWMMTIPKNEIEDRTSEGKRSDSSSSNSRMETRLAELQATCQNLTRQMDNLMKCVEIMNENTHGTSDVERANQGMRRFQSRRSSLKAAVQRWREKVQFQRRLSLESTPHSPTSPVLPSRQGNHSDATFHLFPENSPRSPESSVGTNSDHEMSPIPQAATPLTQSLQTFVQRWRESGNQMVRFRRRSSSRMGDNEVLHEEEEPGQVNPAFIEDTDNESSHNTKI